MNSDFMNECPECEAALPIDALQCPMCETGPDHFQFEEGEDDDDIDY